MKRDPDEKAAPVLYAKGVAKREAILDAALEVFGEVGFHGSSLREIARRCDVSHQSLMHYFETKEALLLAVLRRRDERLRRHFDDPRGMRVQELISLAEDNARVPGLIEMFSMASAEATTPGHPAHEYYAEFYRNIVRSVATYLARAEERGLLQSGISANEAARALLGAQDGLQLQWLYDPDSIDVAQTMRLLLQAMIAVPLGELDDTL